MSRCLKTLTLDLDIGARTPSVALDCWSEVNKHNQSVIYIYSIYIRQLCQKFKKLRFYYHCFLFSAHFKSDAEKSADISTLFDVGGIVGGILAGVISDYYGGRATTCAVMLIIAAPVVTLYLF